jgi:putative Mg2+ transporter-C (MgtC) family protein
MAGDWELIGRMALAAVLGYAIGFERELRGKSAGERTFALVALGAAAVVGVAGAEFSDGTTRVIQGVVTGVGFLGAGLIFQREDRGMVIGLTTAAAVWAAAAVGVLAGVGAYVPAIAGTALAVIILVLDKLPSSVASSRAACARSRADRPPRTRTERLAARELARPRPHAVEHRRCELAGERVLLARMEAAEHRVRADRRLGEVGEARPRPRAVAEPGEGAERAVPRERAEADDDAGVVEKAELACQVR